ncbi:MAG: hypothetical protein IKR21_00930, partial [Oscillospiraceae bacterium]|nr:hypothetical protein [Oscillospiraceae bacterium]
MLKRILSLVLALLLLFGVSASALADDGETVRIYSAEDFLEFAENCSYDAWSEGKTVVLERDISLGGADYMPAAGFRGTFRGGGHTISGLAIRSEVSPAGLFGVIMEGGEVCDLKVEGTVSPGGGAERVGGIAGVNRGTLRDCSFSGTVTGDKHTGGICGENGETGVIRICEMSGGVFGKSMTGGIAGKNSGIVFSCTNRAYVNTVTLDPTVSLSDLDFGLDPETSLSRLINPETYNVATDSGGVAGYSDGLINSSRNYGAIGYQHIGYNVGGIAGRSSGQISKCTNMGQVYGRKDVGGIAGIAEPFIIVNLNGGSLEAVRAELEKLDRLVANAKADAANAADNISNRLSSVGSSVDNARDKTQTLTGQLSDYWEDTASEIDRSSEVLKNAVSMLSAPVSDMKKASDSLSESAAAMEQAAGKVEDSNLSGELSAAARDMSSASELLNTGLSEISDGLDRIGSSIRPADGVSPADWRAALYGTTNADGTHQAGAFDKISAGIGQTVSGLSTLESAARGLAAGIGDGSIATWGAVAEYINASELIAALNKAAEGTAAIDSGVSEILVKSKLDAAAASQGAESIRNGLRLISGVDGTGVFQYISSGFSHIAKATGSADSGLKDIQEALSLLSDSASGLSDAFRETKNILDYVNSQPRLSVSGTGTDDEASDFYDSLQNISNELEMLNVESRNSSKTLINDISAISEQFSAVMYTLIGAVEDAGSSSVSSVVEDASDEDIDEAVRGKIYGCLNMGEVSGDLDAGGIAGSMSVYNELNPEGDDTAPLSSLIHRTYTLKCILQDCVNSGNITGKRNYVGGVAGDAGLGVISGCVGAGRAESQGDYVGGIAGRGDNIIRESWGRGKLSGRDYVGGIVGAGNEKNSNLKVSDCRSLVEITEASRYCGAISGGDYGEFSGNTFVSDDLAGINRISIKGQAEPVTYGELMALGAPKEFESFTLSFVSPGGVIKSQSFNYGDSFDDSVFPEVPPEAGKNAAWDKTELKNLTFDTTVTAVYTPIVEAVRSESARSGGRPVFLALGAFDDGDEVDASPAVIGFDVERGGLFRALRTYNRTVQEQWLLILPDDGADSHTVRYLPPQGNMGLLEVYAAVGDGWERVETRENGSYLEFEMAGEQCYLTVVSAATPWWVWAIAAVLLACLAALAIVLFVKKPKKPVTEDGESVPPSKKQKHRKWLILILAAASVVLAVALAATLIFAPKIAGAQIYTLLKSYADRSDTDMDFSLVVEREESTLRAEAELFTTEFDGKAVSCTTWRDIRACYTDGVLIMEDGDCYKTGGGAPDLTKLLSLAANLFLNVDFSVTDQNSRTTFNAEMGQEEAEKLINAVMPDLFIFFGAPEKASLELMVTDGEPAGLTAVFDCGDKEVSAHVDFVDERRSHELPAAVQIALSSGQYRNAPEADGRYIQTILAWLELCFRDPITADMTLRSNCGPLLQNESLTWQSTERYNESLSILNIRGTTVFASESAACTSGGVVLNSDDSGVPDAEELLNAACSAVILGDPEFEDIPEGTRFTVGLDEEAMTRIAHAAAPETESLNIVFEEGQVRTDIRNGKVTDVVIDCRGKLRVVLEDVIATVSVTMSFDENGELQDIPEA